jgi:hypothetical protein
MKKSRQPTKKNRQASNDPRQGERRLSADELTRVAGGQGIGTAVGKIAATVGPRTLLGYAQKHKIKPQ